MTKKLERRFQELEFQLSVLEATRNYYENTHNKLRDSVDENLFLSWQLKVQNLIKQTSGKNSIFASSFISALVKYPASGNYASLAAAKSVFLALKEEYMGGYLTSVRNLIQAEIVGSELDQARELYGTGYITAAAVITGVALETTMRSMCDDQSIPHGKLDKMNADLYKAGSYNSLVHKQVTAWAGIRNSAAHGKSSEFTNSQVELMIGGVENFIAAALT